MGWSAVCDCGILLSYSLTFMVKTSFTKRLYVVGTHRNCQYDIMLLRKIMILLILKCTLNVQNYLDVLISTYL